MTISEFEALESYEGISPDIIHAYMAYLQQKGYVEGFKLGCNQSMQQNAAIINDLDSASTVALIENYSNGLLNIDNDAELDQPDYIINQYASATSVPLSIATPDNYLPIVEWRLNV